MNKISAVFLILVVTGICVSSYLVYYHYASRAGAEGWCNINSHVNCYNVIQSKYSEIFGVPLAVLGITWFSICFLFSPISKVFSVLINDSNGPFYLFIWSSTGLTAVMVLVYLEICAVGSICILCTICHAMAVGIFGISYTSLKKPISNYVKDTFYY